MKDKSIWGIFIFQSSISSNQINIFPLSLPIDKIEARIDSLEEELREKPR